jgi:hypothetical protein
MARREAVTPEGGAPAGARWSRARAFTAAGRWRKLLPTRRPGLHPTPPAVVYRWDLDKTYLQSDFESLRKMMRVPFERAQDKVDEPGAVALLRSLKESARREERPAFVYFISASPPQIGRAIREKLALDGVEVDGIVFKNQLQHLVRGQFRYLREQVGFKLAELLKARAAAPPDAVEFLFGDDWESDPLIYSLYADTVAGRLGADALTDILVRLRIDPARLVEIKALAQRVVQADAVRRIFINLERRTPPGHFRSFGPRLVPTFNYFQTAIILHEDGMLPLTAVIDVARSLGDRAAYTREHLRNSLEDLRRREYLSAPAAARLHRDLEEAEVLPTHGPRRSKLQRWWRQFRPPRRVRRGSVPAAVIEVDYPRLIDAWITAGGKLGGEAAP